MSAPVLDSRSGEGAQRVALEAARHRRALVLAARRRRDQQYAALGVRVTVTHTADGRRVEWRGSVGGGCCSAAATGFNPTPFDIRIFNP